MPLACRQWNWFTGFSGRLALATRQWHTTGRLAYDAQAESLPVEVDADGLQGRSTHLLWKPGNNRSPSFTTSSKNCLHGFASSHRLSWRIGYVPLLFALLQ